MSFYKHLRHLLGTAALCDDGFGPLSFNDRTAFCLFFFNNCCLGMLSLCRDVGSQLREDCFESCQLVLIFILGFEKKCPQKPF